MPSSITEDTKADRRTDTQLAVRGTGAVDAPAVIPAIWVAVGVAITRAAVNIAVQFAAKKLKEMRDANQHVDDQNIEVVYYIDLPPAQMMDEYVGELPGYFPDFGGYLITEVDTIVDDGGLDYQARGVGFETFNGQVVKCIEISSTAKGVVLMKAEKPDGTPYLWRARGNVFPELIYTNDVVPQGQWKLTFGN
ncbi:hypothetical protein FPV67DRAFT_1552539 [Lyophyllum atratum]|nr:hypothetical protein FPV67DRAFT_1552539 [Lyophyllum atratum]